MKDIDNIGCICYISSLKAIFPILPLYLEWSPNLSFRLGSSFCLPRWRRMSPSCEIAKYTCYGLKGTPWKFSYCLNFYMLIEIQTKGTLQQPVIFILSLLAASYKPYRVTFVFPTPHLLGVRLGCSKMTVALDSRLVFDIGDITVRCFFSRVGEISWKLYGSHTH